jgi:rare lipoprotein A (peptidoglycan hydrolase)
MNGLATSGFATIKISAAAMLLVFAEALAAAPASSAEAKAPAQGPRPAVTKSGRFQQLRREIASFYSTRLRGHRTTSGERYDPNAMTAASKTLPINSQVVVRNPANGKSVQVRVNDRLPRKRRSTIDLSKRAADILDIVRRGRAPVQVALQ